MSAMPVSRRDFLKKTAVMGAGLAALPLLAACGATPTATPVPPTATKAPVISPTATKSAAFDWKRFKGEKIWYSTGARIRPYGYPSAYVPNIVHQNILIFRKE